MNAQEAKIKAKAARIERSSIDAIMFQIQTAANMGDTFIHLPSYTTQEDLNILISNGYKVQKDKVQDWLLKDIFEYKISWG